MVRRTQQVGFIETVKTEQRKSGKEAWSERQHEHALELSVEAFMGRFPSKKIPFHTILYFKQNGIVVWWGLLLCDATLGA